MSYTEFVSKDRRLTILRILLESSAYTANQFLIGMALDEFGHKVSADQLLTDLAWLQEQGLLHIKITAEVHIAALTQRGQDVAEGRTTVPGVKRPSAL